MTVMIKLEFTAIYKPKSLLFRVLWKLNNSRVSLCCFVFKGLKQYMPKFLLFHV
jgi:hypothetical protein